MEDILIPIAICVVLPVMIVWLVTRSKNQIVNRFTQTFNSLGNAFCSKYGNPAVSSEGNAIWRDTNSNSITLNVTLNNSQDELGVHFDGILTVTYRTATTNNDEF